MRFVFAALLLVAAARSVAAPPNILFVLSDDHSYPFLSTYGNPNVRTAALDALAAEGMKFHRFFTAAPQCVPSRAAYLTGRSPVAARMTRFSSPLPRDEVTFMELLRQGAGYYTGIAGRAYHLDGSGAHTATEIGRVAREHGMLTFRERVDYVRTGSDVQGIEQMQEFLAQRPKAKPFCLWLNFSDPHHPWNAPATDRPDPATLKLPAYWPDLPGMREQLADHIAEVNRVDRSMQAVLDLLAREGLAQTTLVVFAGDNGIALPRGKGSLYDPGCNVPFVVRWPGVVKPGGESRALLSGEDLAPTLLAAAGLPPGPKMSGRSFLPLLKGEAYSPSKYVFTERGPHGTTPVSAAIRSSAYDYSRAVRSERYKLIYNCTPWIPYSPVDSAGGAAWREIVAANAAATPAPDAARAALPLASGPLAPELRAAYFTLPRPVYELYDLQQDPAELKNLSGNPELRPIERELRVALMEKMMIDFDYLPLPDLLEDPASAPAKGKKKKQG
jgi:arylsulfatase A-like enzyme